MNPTLKKWLPWIAVAAVALIVIIIIAVNSGGDDVAATTTTSGETTTTVAETTTTTEETTTTTEGVQFEPVPMNLEVIDGFKEALQKMPVGAKWRLFIPSELGYADQRRSAEIGPNTVLIFELELVSIEDAPAHPGGLPFPLPEMPEGE